MTTTHTHAGTDAPECTTCTSQRPTATPKDNRDAWLKLVSHLEAQLLSTRENAKASTRVLRAGLIPVGDTQPEEWEARAWAAQRLLDAIQGLPVPEVPVDHTEGQASILDELEKGRGVTWGPGRAARDRKAALSTSGDEPVEHRPRRLLDREGELWEELETGRWGYCPQGSDPINGGPYEDGPGPGSDLYGPVETLEELVRAWGPVREPEGDEYDRGARDDE